MGESRKKKLSSTWTIFKNYFCETLKTGHGNTTNPRNAFFKKNSKFEKILTMVLKKS
jgi:hypothetical protein